MSLAALAYARRSWRVFGSGAAPDAYAIGGASPELVAAFTTQSDGTTAGEYFRKASSETTFSGLFTHSVSGLLTMFDSTGTLVWAPHNIVTYSQQLDNAAWTKVRASISANAANDPAGNATLDKVVEDTASGTHLARLPAVTVQSGETYTLGFVASAAGRDTGEIRVKTSTAVHCAFDLTNVLVSSGDGSIAALGGGLYYVTFSFTADGAWSLGQINLTETYGGSTSYTGDGSSGMNIGWVHLYRSDLGGMADNPDMPAGLEKYVPTTTAAKYLPRRQAYRYNSGWELAGMQMEAAAATNLISSSQDVTGTGWATATITVTDNQGTGPDGTLSLQNLSDTGGAHEVSYSATVTSGQTYVASFYVEKDEDETRFPELYSLSSSGQAYHLNTKTGATTIRTTVGTPLGDDINVTDLGNLWFVEITLQAQSTTWKLTIRPAGGTVFGTYSAGATGSINAGFFQLELGTRASSYIPTTGSTVTRAAETLQIESSAHGITTGPISGHYRGISQVAGGGSNYGVLSIGNGTKVTEIYQVFGGTKAYLQDYYTGASHDDAIATTFAYGDVVNIAFRAGTAPELAVAGTASGSPSTGGTRVDLSAFPIRINTSYAGGTGNSFIQLVRVWEQDDIGSSGIAEATT